MSKRECPRCHYWTTAKAVCPKCHTQLAATATKPMVTPIICPNCEVEADNNICPVCGGRVMLKKRCHNCKHLFAINDTRCAKCEAGVGEYTIVCVVRNSRKRPTPPKPRRTRWLCWILLAALLLALLLTVAFTGKLTANPTTPPTPSPTLELTPSPTLQPTTPPTPTPILMPTPTATPKPTGQPTPQPTPTVTTRIITENAKWTRFSAGDTVIGWGININGHYFEDRNGVVLYDSPVDGWVIGGSTTPGVINPHDWEISKQMKEVIP